MRDISYLQSESQLRAVCLSPCCLKDVGAQQTFPCWQCPSPPPPMELQSTGFVTVVTMNEFTVTVTIEFSPSAYVEYVSPGVVCRLSGIVFIYFLFFIYSRPIYKSRPT